jgi:prepilin-type N-terminal cleavage/methylation domain-containing protein
MAAKNAGRPEPTRFRRGLRCLLSDGPTAPQSRRSAGFTLIELLVVITVIAADRLVLIAPGHDVIHRILVLDSYRPRHGR